MWQRLEESRFSLWSGQPRIPLEEVNRYLFPPSRKHIDTLRAQVMAGHGHETTGWITVQCKEEPFQSCAVKEINGEPERTGCGPHSLGLTKFLLWRLKKINTSTSLIFCPQFLAHVPSSLYSFSSRSCPFFPTAPSPTAVHLVAGLDLCPVCSFKRCAGGGGSE